MAIRRHMVLNGTCRPAAERSKAMSSSTLFCSFCRLAAKGRQHAGARSADRTAAGWRARPRHAKNQGRRQRIPAGPGGFAAAARYLWRGLPRRSSLPGAGTQRFTLAAIENQQTIGTITVAFDGAEKLSADDAFPAEVQAMREEGQRICEFRQAGGRSTIGTKRVLAALFHVAYIVAHRMRGYDAC